MFKLDLYINLGVFIGEVISHGAFLEEVTYQSSYFVIYFIFCFCFDYLFECTSIEGQNQYRVSKPIFASATSFGDREKVRQWDKP